MSHVSPQSVQMWTQPPRRRPTVVVVASTDAPSSPQPQEPIAREPPPRRAEEGFRGSAGRRRSASQQRTKTAAAGEGPAEQSGRKPAEAHWRTSIVPLTAPSRPFGARDDKRVGSDVAWYVPPRTAVECCKVIRRRSNLVLRVNLIDDSLRRV